MVVSYLASGSISGSTSLFAFLPFPAPILSNNPNPCPTRATISYHKLDLLKRVHIRYTLLLTIHHTPFFFDNYHYLISSFLLPPWQNGSLLLTFYREVEYQCQYQYQLEYQYAHSRYHINPQEAKLHLQDTRYLQGTRAEGPIDWLYIYRCIYVCMYRIFHPPTHLHTGEYDIWDIISTRPLFQGGSQEDLNCFSEDQRIGTVCICKQVL